MFNNSVRGTNICATIYDPRTSTLLAFAIRYEYLFFKLHNGQSHNTSLMIIRLFMDIEISIHSKIFIYVNFYEKFCVHCLKNFNRNIFY